MKFPFDEIATVLQTMSRATTSWKGSGSVAWAGKVRGYGGGAVTGVPPRLHELARRGAAAA
jgi:hypothetical protein